MDLRALPAWLNRTTVAITGAVTLSAVAAGAGVASAVALPAHVTNPPKPAEIDLADAQDPGRSEWEMVIAGLGGLEATRVVSAAYLEPLPVDRVAYHEEMRDIEARLDDLAADIEASEAAWSEARASTLVVASAGARSQPPPYEEPPIRVYETRSASRPVLIETPAGVIFAPVIYERADRPYP